MLRSRFFPRQPRYSSQEPRLAYYFEYFPVLSQTFVQTELATLRDMGANITVLASHWGGADTESALFKTSAKTTSYLARIERKKWKQYRRRNLFFRPHTYVRLKRFIAECNYGPQKNAEMDATLFARALCLAGVLEDKRIEHIHAPWADTSALVALMAARFVGIPYSVHARASHDLYRYDSRFAHREKFEFAEFIVTNSAYNVNHIRSLIPASQHDKIKLVYDGIDIMRFSRGAHTVNHRGIIKLVCVARLIEAKGIEYLLQACSILLQRGLRVVCEIVGGPDTWRYPRYHETLFALRASLGLTDCVTFLGPKAHVDVHAILCRADIFVLPCVVASDGSNDITPNSLMEAMAMEIPIISTTITAIPEVVEHNVSGILVPPRNAEALANAIEELVNDPATRERLGASARERVSRQFDAARNIAQLAQLFSV